MSGRSRIVVTMPSEANSISFDLDSMLTVLREWPMRLDFNAIPDGLENAVSMQNLTQSAAFRNLLEQAVSNLYQLSESALSGVSQSQSAQSTERSLTSEDNTDNPNSTLYPLLPILFGPHQPDPSVTALEIPYRLILSPLQPAQWRHSNRPITHRGRTELWHTRLTTSKQAVGADKPSSVRAIWSPDYRPQNQIGELIKLLSKQPQDPNKGPEPNPDLIRMSLDPLDRSMLITLMAGFNSTQNNGVSTYHPLSSEAKRLHLSALGALLDAEGNWVELPDNIDLQEWRHMATLGRDHYVRVMYAGYLCPFGHSASLIKVTERNFQNLEEGKPGRVAILRQRFFIVVREPVRKYDGLIHSNSGRDFPFSQIEILTRVTPDLAEPGMLASALNPNNLYDEKLDEQPEEPALAKRMLFWPMVPTAKNDQLIDVPFEIAGTDIAGNRVTFSMPLLFISKIADDNPSKSKAIKEAYNNTSAEDKRRAFLGGGIVCYAPVDPTDKGDTRLPTKSITFKAGDLTSSSDEVRPRFYPEIDVAEVGIKPIQKLLSQPDFVVQVAYPEFYKSDGFSPINKGKVFLQLTTAKPLEFGGGTNKAKSDTLGALASPQMNLLGLSKIMGPVGGKHAAERESVAKELNKIQTGTFDPAVFFSNASLLGGISLSDILGQKSDLMGVDVPKMVSREFPDRVESTFDWETEISESRSALLIPKADNGNSTRLSMHSRVQTPLDPAKQASFEATATLNNFKINLFDFIILWFEQLTFNVKQGQKPDVAVELRQGDDAVTFGGPLEFVNELRQYIPANGFADSPSLSVTPSGIAAAYSLTLPSIEVGAFAISNASLGAAFNLPFDSRPMSVRFNFSERHHPFSLTVSLLGGGGFFLMGVSSRGVNEIEAALEFGAAIAIDLGVASGGVEVKGGIYFHWLEAINDENETIGSVELAGYVRIQGELSVLGIISASLTFNLQLAYGKQNGRAIAYGEATLVVEIDILFFSTDVSVHCRKEFTGGSADPKFLDLIPTETIWQDYCKAFAVENG